MIRILNYQAAMGAYEKHLWDKILRTLQAMPDPLKTEDLNIYTETNTLAKQQRVAAKHTADTASKAMLTSIVVR